MATLFDSPELSTARNEANAAANTASALGGQAQSLPDILHETLVKKFTNDNPLYATRENAAKNFLTTYTQAPLDYTAKSAGGKSDVIYDPQQLQHLIQSRRAGALAPLTTANDQLSLATGGLDNILSSAKNIFSGIVKKSEGEASSKRQTYEDLFKEISARSDEEFKNKQLAQALQIATMKTNASKKNSTAAKKLRDQMLAVQGALGDIGAAEQAFNASGSGADLNDWFGLRSHLPEGLGGYGEKPATTKSAFAAANSALFDIAGKAFTGSERKLLEGLVLDIGKNPTANKSAIAQAKRKLTEKLLGLQDEYNADSTDTSSDWEIVQ